MNLLELIDWTKKAQDLKSLREKITKESDINVCLSLLGEIRHRAGLAIDHAKKSARYEKDIEEYLSALAKRGVTVPEPEPEKVVGAMTEPLAMQSAAPSGSGTGKAGFFKR